MALLFYFFVLLLRDHNGNNLYFGIILGRSYMIEANIILSTFSNIEEAQKISHELLKRKLIACVNLIPQITSIYRWQGEIDQTTETLAIMKTSPSNLNGTINLIKSLHSYDTPEIIALDSSKGLQQYFDWLKEETEN